VRVWEVATGKPVRQLPASEAFSRDVVFSPDGQTLAATDGHGVRLWDPGTGKERLAAFGHWAPVEALVVSADGKTVTSVDAEAVLTWETATGRGLTRCAVSRGRSLATGLLLPVALAPGARHFAVADADGTVRVRATATGKEVRRFAVKGEALDWFAWSPDGKTLATVGQARVGAAGPQTVRFWDAATGAAGRRLPAMPPGPLAFAPDGKLLATADGTGTDPQGSVALWRVADGKRVRRLGAERLSLGSLAFSPDGKILATAGDRLVTEGAGVSVRLWDVASGRRLRAFLKTDPRFPRMEVLAFAPNGRTLATGGRDGVVRLWEAATGAERGHFKTGQGPIHSLAFTPDGTRLLSGGQDSTALVWEVSRALPSGAGARGDEQRRKRE
jgi:WD40 repeat protein